MNMTSKKALVTLLLGCVLALPGCIGPFPMTTDVYRRNMKIENKAGREALFLALVVVPVYPIGLIADLLVLNPITYFTDEEVWTPTPERGSPDAEP
jgi:hypothetical protein